MSQKNKKMSTRLFFSLVFFPQFIIFLLTATWSLPYHIDSFTNVLSGWNLGKTGSFYLDQHKELAEPEYFRQLALVVPAKDSAVSQYPPGTALLLAPLYWIWPEAASSSKVRSSSNPEIAQLNFIIPPIAPAAIVAALSVALASSFLALIFLSLGSITEAFTAAYIFSFATSAWTVAADQAWQHGPAMMWIAVGLYLSTKAQSPKALLYSGLSFGAALLTRPLTAIIAAVTGIAVSVERKKLSPVFLVGAGSTLGLLFWIYYNSQIYGSPSASGGYTSAFSGRILATNNFLNIFKEAFMLLFSEDMGLLIYSPFLLPLIMKLKDAWRAAPITIRGSALGGFIYMIVHLKANRFSGGAGFLYYRYPLELLTASAPLLFLAYTEGVKSSPLLQQRIFGGFCIIAVIFHGLVAI